MKTLTVLIALASAVFLSGCGIRSIPANPAITGHAAGIVPTTVGFNANGTPMMGFSAAPRMAEDREASQARSFYGQ